MGVLYFCKQKQRTDMNGIFIRLKSLWLALAAIVAGMDAWAQTWDSLPSKRAAELFAEAQRVCAADGGRLWGENIWGPVLLVRDADKLAFTNEPSLLRDSRKMESLYCGTLDSDIVVAGSAVSFRGMDVAMVPMFDLTDSALVEVFVHELFHRFQNRHYGRDEMVYDNAHVDSKTGRTLVLCELMELAKALNSNGEEMRSHLEKALGYRRWRWTLFPGKITDECRFEFQEGLALYTQYRLCLSDSAKVAEQLCRDVERMLTSPNLSRQYGYYMGAIYGCLNDIEPSWRREVEPSRCLCEFAGKAYAIDFSMLKDTMALRQTESYIRVTQGVDTLEAARRATRNMVLQAIQSKNVVYLCADDYQMGFNPACVTGLDELGAYFSVIELKGDFGRCYSAYGCLISNRPMLILPPKQTKKRGTSSSDFAIELKKGWRMKKCADGYEIVKRKKH